MSISINTNLAAMQSQRALWNFNQASQSVMKKLSSGIRINSASDDAANLSLSKKLEKKYSGLSVANNNINTALGKLQTYDGYLSGVSDSLHKMRELATQAANGVYSSSERAMLDAEVNQLLKETNIAQKGASSEVVDKVSVGLLSEEEAISQGYTLITTAVEFQTQLNASPNGKFILMNDIDMSELGTLNNSAITTTFTGEFNGNGFTIDNLSIDTGGSALIHRVGLFSRADGATIENVALEDVSISATNSNHVGGLLGWGGTLTTVDNSYVLGSVEGNENVGGLIGISFATTSNSYSSGSVVGDNRVGGLIGLTYSATTVEDSFTTSNVVGNTNIGGFVGADSGGSIGATNFYDNNMTVSATSATTNQSAATAGWDTSVWDLSNGSPELKVFIPRAEPMSVQIGENADDASVYEVAELALDLDLGVNLSSASSARAAMSAIDDAIELVNEKRSSVGAHISNFESIVQNNTLRHDKLMSSSSTIRDTDMAIAAADMAKNQILTQSTTAMLQQAQQLQSQTVLSLY